MINYRCGRIFDKLQLFIKLSSTCYSGLYAAILVLTSCLSFLLRPKFMKEMSNRSELLEKLTNISEECSDIESDATNSELSSEDEADYIQSKTSDTEDGDGKSITNVENESVINMPSKWCRVVSSSDSNGETENTFQETETAANSTVWSKFDKGGIPERFPSTYFQGCESKIMGLINTALYGASTVLAFIDYTRSS